MLREQKNLDTQCLGYVSQNVSLIPKTRRGRNQHSLAFQTPIANTDVYKSCFFPQTALPDSLISSAEDVDDCVAKFTSLVRARDNSLITGPDE